MIERIIAYHCAPALAGIKPANIVACYKDKIPSVHQELKRLNDQLNRKGIYFEILCECEKRVLLMVYRKDCLYRCLCGTEIKALLHTFGYGSATDLQQYIAVLKRRLCGCEFPHEIGAFLGYPAHDIYGFMHHRDEGCLLTGEWKVYKDAETAKQLFFRYNACRCALVKRIAQGKTLAEIFCAA